ncbi:hypothetical protein CW733_00825 [Lacinutrix sp. Bg11-31]|nr:hypothetical protein CW733_00825 [Lacinutrix sp. Bg11-31]
MTQSPNKSMVEKKSNDETFDELSPDFKLTNKPKNPKMTGVNLLKKEYLTENVLSVNIINSSNIFFSSWSSFVIFFRV